jgi:hypothetical protein
VTLTLDRPMRTTDQADSICCTLSRPLSAVPHWDLITSILLEAIRLPRSRSSFMAIPRAIKPLDAASESAPTAKTTSATITSINV